MQVSEKCDAWLEISLGSESDFQAASAEYNRFCQFYKQKGASFGYTAKEPKELSVDDSESLLELYNSDPNFSKQGTARTSAPTPLILGKLYIELITDVPKAAANFKALCTGEKGKASVKGKMLHYKGVKFHRIVKGTLCQGGDIIRGDGSAGESIYGPKFNDEKEGLKHKHDAAGVLSMANSGKNSNSSQFFFTQCALPQLDGKHVVFGRIVKGLEILKQIDSRAASADGKPLIDVWISDCGA